MIAGCCRSLESQEVGSGYQGLADVTFVFSAVTLVQYGQRDPAGERPLQGVVPLGLHHVYKQRDVGAVSCVHAIRVYPRKMKQTKDDTTTIRDCLYKKFPVSVYWLTGNPSYI